MKIKIKNYFQNPLRLFIVFFLYSTTTFSQRFENAYGTLYEDNAECIILGIDGGYLMAGWTFDTINSYEILLIKTNPAGTIVWSETIGGPNDEQAFWVSAAKDSTYLICGNSFDNINNKRFAFVIRISKTGAILFQKTYAVNFEERSACVIETNDGGIAVAGETVLGGIDMQMNLLKTDVAGNVLWSRAFGDTEQESANYVIQTDDNGFIMSGISRYGLSWSSIYIVKTDSSGNLQWSNKYNTSPYLSRCEMSRILKTPNHGYLISGVTSANQPLKYIFLMEIDSMGSIIWQSIYGTGGGERNSDIIYDENGYVVCGSTSSNSGYDNLLLLKTDLTGNLQWALAYGKEDSNTVANSLVKTDDGKYMVAGYTDAYGIGETDCFLIKSDSLFDGSLCDMKVPAIIQDTITLVATPATISSTVNMIGQNAAFILNPGINETPVCVQTVQVNSIGENINFSIAPNPSNGIVTISFTTIESETGATLEIYDSFGRKIKSTSDQLSSNCHQFIFSRGETEIPLNSGIYYCVLSSGAFRLTGKIVFVN